jgi:hypothetical protein
MVIPGRLALIREIAALQQQGVPRWTATLSVRDKYGLSCLPPYAENHLRIRQTAARVRGLMARHTWPMTKAGCVRALFWPYAPTFPLDTTVVNAVNAVRNLPGGVPTRMRDVLFGRFAFSGIENIRALEDVIRVLHGALLWRQRYVCTVRGRGHLWLEFRTLTYVRGHEWYCGHCLVVKLAGFRGWPTPPRRDAE